MSHRCDPSHRQLSKSNLIYDIMTLSETEGMRKYTDGWGNTLMDVPTSCILKTIFTQIHSPCNKMLLLSDTDRQHWYIQAHINPLAPPPAPHRTLLLHHTQPSLSHADCSAWFTSYYWLAPLRGQVHCQSGWHIVFHSTNQQTAPWWVSTLVVKVTFDGWEGYGSECWGDCSRQLVP